MGRPIVFRNKVRLNYKNVYELKTFKRKIIKYIVGARTDRAKYIETKQIEIKTILSLLNKEWRRAGKNCRLNFMAVSAILRYPICFIVVYSWLCKYRRNRKVFACQICRLPNPVKAVYRIWSFDHEFV